MKFAIAPVTYWDSIGFDTTEWRKSLDGTKAICHLEYAEKLGANLHANPQVQIIDSVDPNLKNILESSEWVIDGTNGDLDSFSFLTKLNQFETKVNDAVSEKVAINEQKVLSVESQLQQTEQSLNAQLAQIEQRVQVLSVLPERTSSLPNDSLIAVPEKSVALSWNAADWQLGSLSSAAGTPFSSKIRIRPTVFLPVEPGTEYIIFVDANSLVSIFEHRADDTFISSTGWLANEAFHKFNPETAKMKMLVRNVKENFTISTEYIKTAKPIMSKVY